MERQNRRWIVEVVLVPFRVLALVLTGLYKVLFGWWFDPWSQRSANQALWDDVQSNFFFLCEQGRRIAEGDTRILPFDYASVYLEFENIRFCFKRGRGEFNVSLSPRYAPSETYLLDVVIAVIEAKDVTEIEPIGRISDVADVLRPRIDALNDQFSESQYPRFKTKLLAAKDSVCVMTRQVEWDLNRTLYRGPR